MLAASGRIDAIRRALRTSDSKHDRLIHGETARADLASINLYACIVRVVQAGERERQFMH